MPPDPTSVAAAPVGGDRAPIVQLPVVLAASWLGFAFGLEGGVLAVVACAALWPPRVPWRPVAARRVLLGYVPFAVAWLVFVVAYLRIAHACGFVIPPQPMLETMAKQGTAMPGFVLAVFGIVAIAPVVEEVLFRGYLFTALDVVLPRWATQVATAAVFGLLHGPGYALPIGVLSLYFGWQRAKNGSLLPSILAHAVHNGLTVAVTVLWPGHLELLYPR